MTEVRRVTSAPVNWGSFQRDCVLALATARNRRVSSRENRVLLFAASGVALADVRLGDDIIDVHDASANGAGAVACCATCGVARRTILLFAAGRHVLSAAELPRRVGEGQIVSVLCTRMGGRDVAVCAAGDGQIMRCHRDGEETVLETICDFGPASVRQLMRGRSPREVIVLLDDGNVALVTIDGGTLSFSDRLRERIAVSPTVAAVSAVFSGRQLLWVLLEDATLCGFWFPSGGASPVRITAERLSFLPPHVKVRVAGSAADSARVFLAGETTGGGVHVAAQTGASIHFAALTLRSRTQSHFNSETQFDAQRPKRREESPPVVLGWSHGALAWTGHVHAFSFSQRAYELLVQNEFGSSPLSVLSLRQNSSVLNVAVIEDRPLTHQILRAAGAQLALLRGVCEKRVAALEESTGTVADTRGTEEALAQLLDTQHCLVAMLHREREVNCNIPSPLSVSMHLIRRLHAVFIRLSVCQLLFRLGAGGRLDVPLGESLGLDAMRCAAAASQAALREETEAALGIVSTTATAELRLWGPLGAAPALCISAIIAQTGCGERETLRGVVQQATSLPPALALLVLYCTIAPSDDLYAGIDAPQNNNNNNSNNKKKNKKKKKNSSNYDDDDDDDNTSHNRDNSNTNATGRGSRDGDEVTEVENATEMARVEFLNSFCLPSSLSRWARLAHAADWQCEPRPGSCPAAADCPPLNEMTSGLINGLTFARAYETVFLLTGPVLAVGTAAHMDPAVAVKLVFLAYKRGNAPVVEALYRRAKGKTWEEVATHALAWAALRSNSVKLLSGLISPGSVAETVVEGVIRRCPEEHRGDVLRMEFYILMQRYKSALHLCERIAASDTVSAQRVQIIASHLRSLMPNGNGGGDNDTENAENENEEEPKNTAVALLRAAALLTEDDEINEAVARTAARITARNNEEWPPAARRERSIPIFAPTPAAALVVASSAVDEPRRLSETPSHYFPKEQFYSESVASSRNSARRTAAADADPFLCDAIIKRSGKPCGRRLPCEYHTAPRRGIK